MKTTKSRRCGLPRRLLLLAVVAAAAAAVASSSSSDHEEGRVEACYVDEHGEIVCAGDDYIVQQAATGGDHHHEEPHDTCNLYLAPSSIPGAGFGIYTVRALARHDVILEHDSPNVAVVDVDVLPAPYSNLFGDVWWAETKGMGDTMRFEAALVNDFQPMFGALPNFHPTLYNLGHVEPDLPYDDRDTHHVGAGAYSYYRGKHFMADKAIGAGREIFLNYGEGFFNQPGYEAVPRRRDYEQAGRVLAQQFSAWSEQGVFNATTYHMAEAAIVAGLEQLYTNTRAESERVASLLPRTVADVQRVVQASLVATSHTNPLHPLALSRAVATEISTVPRTINWIRTHGQCLDNLVPRPSTIPYAGQGGFAQRPLAAGDVIVPVPLLHIEDRDMLATFAVYVDEDEEILVRNVTQRVGTQLLLNYCFGHPDSSLLLCPVTNALLINHCSTRSSPTCGPHGPNAEYRWASTWDPATARNLQKSWPELMQSPEWRILSLDIVATRDIAAGDEVFIDYGELWETAWTQHVATWEAPDDDKVSVAELNQRLQDNDNDDEETSAVLMANELPEHVFTGCWFDENALDTFPEYDGEAFEQWSNEDMEWSTAAETFGRDGSSLVPSDGDYGWYWPCAVIGDDEITVLDGDGGNDGETALTVYTVRVFPNKNNRAPAWEKAGVPCILYNYHKEGLRYFTKPYYSDQHAPNAFRHYIQLRDDLFPAAWKNLLAESSDENGAATQNTTFAKLDKVEALYDGEWHWARIIRVRPDDDTYDVLYDASSGDVESNVPASRLRPVEHDLTEVRLTDFVW